MHPIGKKRLLVLIVLLVSSCFITGCLKNQEEIQPLQGTVVVGNNLPEITLEFDPIEDDRSLYFEGTSDSAAIDDLEMAVFVSDKLIEDKIPLIDLIDDELRFGYKIPGPVYAGDLIRVTFSHPDEESFSYEETAREKDLMVETIKPYGTAAETVTPKSLWEPSSLDGRKPSSPDSKNQGLLDETQNQHLGDPSLIQPHNESLTR